jgi:hypothetical protein
MSNIGVPEILLILFIVAVFGIIVLIPYWRIFRKAGFAPPLSFLMVVPLVNVAMLYFLAFMDWPALKDHPE